MSESNNNIPMRITQLTESAEAADGQFVPVANTPDGTKKISLSSLSNGVRGQNSKATAFYSKRLISNGVWPYCKIQINAKAGEWWSFKFDYISEDSSNINGVALYDDSTTTYVKDLSRTQENVYKFGADMTTARLVFNLNSYTSAPIYITVIAYKFGDRTTEDIKKNHFVYETEISATYGSDLIFNNIPLYAERNDIVSFELIDDNSVLKNAYNLYFGYKNNGSNVDNVLTISNPFKKGTTKLLTDFDMNSFRLYVSSSEIAQSGSFKLRYKNLTKLGIEPERKHYTSFSILGDSYSTFKGYTTPTTEAQWYPANDPSCEGYNSGNNVNEVFDTWWYKVARNTELYLKTNASRSGSTIGYDSYGSGSADGKTTSFIQRAKNLENSSLCFIFGGTNDNWAGEQIGDYKYSDWTEEDLSYFAPALAYLIYELRSDFIGMDLVFITNDALSNDFKTVIDTVCAYYSVPVIKPISVSKTHNHPNKAGMQTIANYIIKYLKNSTTYPYYE
jgi:hypothetical protein